MIQTVSGRGHDRGDGNTYFYSNRRGGGYGDGRGDGRGSGNGGGDNSSHGDGDGYRDGSGLSGGYIGSWPSHFLVADTDEESCMMVAAVEVVQ